MRLEDDVPVWKVLAVVIGIFIICGLVGLGMVLFLPRPSWAEGWDTDDPDLASWFATQVVKTCCDQKDAYLADQVDGDGDNIIAVITDGSANEKYSKPAIPNGTRIVIPRDRMKFDPPVPGGHGVVFLSKDNRPPEQRTVYCAFMPWGL